MIHCCNLLINLQKTYVSEFHIRTNVKLSLDVVSSLEVGGGGEKSLYITTALY